MAQKEEGQWQAGVPGSDDAEGEGAAPWDSLSLVSGFFTDPKATKTLVLQTHSPCKLP